MEEMKFRNLEELYNHVLPALSAKKNEIIRNKIKYINEIDIWNALRVNKWVFQSNLTISDMVDDILNTNISFFDSYVKQEYSKMDKEIITEENDLL